ncbi:MAG: hypothetical protein JW786_12375 [Desulfobacterales bacterium]|nr:hypothetical protein [Desulfobacterales bacterium]
MRCRLILIWIIVGLLSLPVYGYCVIEEYEYVEQFGCNYINWTRGFIQAKGIGIPTEKKAEKDHKDMMAAAYADALQNLLEVVKEVRIDFKTKIRDFSAENDIMSKIESMLKRAQVVEQQYFSDGSLEVTLLMSLYGGLAQLVLPQEIQQVESIKPVGVVTEKPVSEIYTGLVVDARGLNVKAAMSPKILDENGREAYGAAFVSREFAVQQGMSGYMKDFSAAQTDPRVLNSPLTVKGLRIQDARPTDIVISNADASKLRSASENLFFLKKCRVIIVIE